MTPAPSHRVIACPLCATRYRLPVVLMGPYGARIRCPGCDGRFTVERRPTRARPAPAADGAAAPPFDAALDDALAACLDRMGAERLRDAAAAGTLFRDHGQEILGAFDRYRVQAGARASAASFRAALAARYGVTLPAPDAGA